MEVNTKYDLDDRVWTVINNKVEKQIVTGITVYHTFKEPYLGGGEKIDILYDLNWQAEEVPENRLFSTKEELLKSL